MERKPSPLTAGDDANSALAGLTLTGATQGLYCRGSSPTIRNCRIVDNVQAGVKLWESSNPTIVNCVVAGKGGDSVEMWTAKAGRTVAYNFARIVWYSKLYGMILIAKNFSGRFRFFNVV